MTKQTMEQVVNDTLAQFDTVKRGEDTITILKQSASEDLRDSMRTAHGDRLPDDWIYDKYHSILDTLAGYTIDDVDGLEDNRAEIVDGLVDVYTSDLTAWLNSHNANVYYITEAQEEYGTEADGFKLLMLAQYKAIDEIYSEVVSYLSAQFEE